MATIFRLFLRRTPMLYRSKIVVSSYRSNHRNIVTNITSAASQNTKRLVESAQEKLIGVPTAEYIQYKQLDNLKSDADNWKRVNYEGFCKVVNSGVEDYLSPSNGVFLLECCTMLPDTGKPEIAKLIEKIWTEGIVRSGQPTKQQIIALLRAYRAIGRTIDDFNSFLAQYNCEGDVELYEEFLYLACENGAVSDRIVKVLSDIKDRGFSLTENLFNALILGHSRNKSVENCEKVLETMVTTNLEPSSETYMQLVRAYIENGESAKANKLLSERVGTFSQEQTFSIIRTAAVNDSVELVKEAMRSLPQDSLFHKSVVPGLRNICVELIHTDKVEIAYSIVDNLPKIKFSETEDTDAFGVFFLKEMIRRNHDWTKIQDIAQRLIDSGRNKRALHGCCAIMLAGNSPHALDCIKLLGRREPLRPHYFWPLFINHYIANGENGILNVLQQMKQMKVQLDEDTLHLYVLKYMPLTMKDVKQAIRILSDKGIPIALLLTPVVSHLLRQYKVADALSIIKLHQAKVDADTLLWPLIMNIRSLSDTSSPIAPLAELVHTIDARNHKESSDLAGQLLVEAISRNKPTDDASVFVSVLEQFHTIGFRIPTATGDQLLGHIQRNLPMKIRKKCSALIHKMVDKAMQTNATENTGIFKHPRDMTLDELECHLIELQSKNMNARGVLRRLLQLLVRAGKLDRALEVNKLCEQNQVEFSPGMLASIMDLMIRTKNLSEAEQTFDRLKKLYPSFAVDEFKVIDLAALLIENERIDQAQQILEARAKSKLLGGAHCQKNIWALLSNVATFSAKIGSPVNQTHEFLQFLVKLGYCNYHNTLLGPVIREHLLKNEITEAIAEFEKVSAKHKKTPMHFELFTKLIEISNDKDGCGTISPIEARQLLTKITGVVASIHGSPNTNVSLVVAFAKAGTEGQLRKLLLDPKLELNAEFLLKQCEHLSSTAAETALLKLAKCIRSSGRISSAFKEQDLYDLLLNEYTRKNDYTAALALFERITADEELKVTNDFARKVADLLEKNNLELPTVLRMRLGK